MEKIESLEEFYQRKFNWIPENLKNDLGHFNLFSVKPYLEGKLKAVPYRRRDFYKIMLFKGISTVHFADRVYEVKKTSPFLFESLGALQMGPFGCRGLGDVLHFQCPLFLQLRTYPTI